jgi:hypothetical protein
MGFFSRKPQPADEPREVDSEEQPVTRPFAEVIASIEQTVDNFKDVDLPHWKYREIIRDGKRSADKALTEAHGGSSRGFIH